MPLTRLLHDISAQDRQASIARIKEIDRLGEAKDVQGLLRFASEHVQSFNYRHCGAWLSRYELTVLS